MIPISIVPQVEALLEHYTHQNGRIDECRMLGGGSINEACRMTYGGKTFFIKWNHANSYPKMFQTESLGLELLRKAHSLIIPEVIGADESGNYSFLILEYIRQGPPNKNFWIEFGHNLAHMHRISEEKFGLAHDNYIGSLPQYNRQTSDWPSFFVEQRLEPQLKMAAENSRLDQSFRGDFKKLFSKIHDLFPAENPALLHGDLWSGNFLCNSSSEAVLIDPAVYYGHREMDIAMSKLFGGFEPAFYHAYHEEWPLEQGWQERIDLCNLYPLMVHVNLFGGSYLMQVRNILRKLV